MSAREWKPGNVVVIDLEDMPFEIGPSILQAFPTWLRTEAERAEKCAGGVKFPRASLLRSLAAQIERQITPKPPEPTGLGAVVEDSEGVRWVRTAEDPEDHYGKPWQSGPVHKHWQVVDAVRVLSEGIQ